MKVQATCIECPWRSGEYRSGLTSKGARTEGEAHRVATGHSVSVPKFARGKVRILPHQH
jgi:hypothetical protein